LDVSPDQQFLFYHLDIIKNEFIQNSRKMQEEMQKGIHLFGYNIKNIPQSVKLGFFLGVFVIFIIGTLFLLGKVSKDKKKTKKNK
jgi:hypothetical protein